MIKAEITAKKECTIATEGIAKNILEELVSIIPMMIISILEELNFPEEVNKDIVREIIYDLKKRFLS